MERERLENGCFRVFLSDEELQDWGLSFEGLSARSPCTRALLSAILAAASEGETECIGGMTAEVFPVEGGCFLLFSGEASFAAAKGPFCAAFAETDVLLAFCRAAAVLSFSESALIACGGRWWLVLTPTASCEARAAALLSEWECDCRSGNAAAAFLAEHGRVIYEKGALERLHKTG